MQSMFGFLKSFRDDEEGSMAIELLLVVPILLWVFLSCFVYFDVYRVETNSVRATITLAEMFSREDTVNSNYLDNTRSVLREMTFEEADPDYRITVFTFSEGVPSDPNDDAYLVVWSDHRGYGGPVTNDDLITLDNAGRLPAMNPFAQNVYIETRTEYDAPFNIGIGPFTAIDLEDLTFQQDMLITPRGGRLCYDPTPGVDGDEVCDAS